MQPEEQIKIEGHGLARYGDVSDSVIQLSGQWFWRDDEERLVRIPNKDKKGYRLYRKASRLIIHVGGGKYILKSEAIQTEDGYWLSKENAVMVDGKPVRANYCTKIGEKYYLLTDPKITKCAFRGTYVLIKDAIKLSDQYYPGKYVAGDEEHNLVKTSKGWIKTADSTHCINAAGEVEVLHRNELKNVPLFQVFYKFRDETNPQLDRIDFANAKSADRDKFKHHDGIRAYIHTTMFDAIDKIYVDVFEKTQRDETDKVRKRINKNFSDVGDDENQAKIISMDFTTWPGKQKIYENANRPVISRTCKKLGGMSYTFGVEFETSAGKLSRNEAESLDLLAVGDRSIGAAEYVTPVLHGDDGLARVKKICDLLAKRTLVDDRCGLHIHIGGMKDVPHVTVPLLNREFAVKAIKLGTQIEEDLYKISPSNREPELYHCHSIMRWKNIDENNWRDYLGAYVFGPKENWSEPFRFSKYTYGGDGRTGSSSVGTWCGGRYKWLNLCHAVAKSTHKTCEFRIFAGTTNYEKVYAYILISMAFVWLVENKPGMIEKGTNLEGMLKAAYAKAPEQHDFLMNFIASRKAKFNRTKIYRKSIPSPEGN